MDKQHLVIAWRVEDIEAIVGRELSDEEVAAIEKALDFSTLGEVVSDVVFGVVGYSEDDDDDAAE